LEHTSEPTFVRHKINLRLTSLSAICPARAQQYLNGAQDLQKVSHLADFCPIFN